MIANSVVHHVIGSSGMCASNFEFIQHVLPTVIHNVKRPIAAAAAAAASMNGKTRMPTNELIIMNL